MAHKVIVNLNIFSTVPLYQQLADELKAAISAGRLRAGERLPSIRELSKQLQISTITVREAMDRLVNQDLVESRHGSGNYVAPNVVQEPSGGNGSKDEDVQFTQATYEASLVELDADVPWSSEARLLTKSFNDSAFHPWWDLQVTYDFRVYQAAMEPVEGLHWNKVVSRWARRRAMRRQPQGSTDPRGLPDLRKEICQWLERTRGMQVNADDLLITSGAQQARDFIARLLVDPGTGVVIEEPGSITDSLAYSSKGADLIHIHQDEEGIDTRQLEHVKTASVAHLIASANFPTGATLSLDRREKVLDWAQATNATLVEDSYGAGFYYDLVVPTLVTLAGLRDNPPRVVYIGTLSQFINPALRLGYIVMPRAYRDAFIAQKWMAERHPSIVPQELALMLFQDGVFVEDSMRLTQATRLRRKALLAALEKWPPGLVRYTPVKAGFHQAIWFNETVDDLLVFERALARGIGVIPLSPYFFSESPKPGLSLSFVQMSEEKITQGMQQLLEIVQECCAVT